MKTYTFLIFIVALAGALMFFANPSWAAKGIIKTSIGGGGGSNITVTELGVENPGILPTSSFYFFKEWRRGIVRIFTFNSVKKAEWELRIMNEKAAEALQVQEVKPDDADALATAFENYTKAEERLQKRLMRIKENSENPNVEKLLEKLNEQTLQHAVLLNQLVERWDTDSHDEDANIVNPQGARVYHLQGTVEGMQKKIQEIVSIAAEKDKNIKQKAEEQIARTETAIHDLTFALAEFAINEPGAPNNRAINTKDTNAIARTGPIRLDPTPARISTNMTIERQTPKRDFGDRIKTGLEMAGGMLASAKVSFAEEKFGEAFGQARAAEVLARNGLRMLMRDGADADAPRIEDVNSAMPIVPGAGKAGESMVPVEEKRVFPETNNRTFCDDREAKPACPRGEILDCHDGKWSCIGPATGGGIVVNPGEGSATDGGDIKSSE